MPEDHDIEKTLRDYAKRRREQGGPPPELHPATRRLLQDEVANLRRENRAPQKSGFGWVGVSPAWLAFTVVLVAVLAVGLAVVVSRSGRAPSQLASGGAPQPAQVISQGTDTNSNLFAANTLAKAGSNTAPAGNTAGSRNPATPEGAVNSPVLAAPEMAVTPSMSPPSGSPPAPGGAVSAAATAPPVTRQFNRLSLLGPTQFLGNSLRQSMLSSFRVEQNGDDLRVIDDSDGSVYSGKLTNNAPPATFAATVITQDGSPPVSTQGQLGTGAAVQPGATNATVATGIVSATATTNAPAIPNYSFTVSGTNVTLNQLIVMSGTVGPGATPFGRGGGGRGGAFGGAAPAPGRAATGGAGGGGGGGFGGGGGGGVGSGPPANGPGTAPPGAGALGGGGLNAARGGRGGARGPTPFQLSGTLTIGTNQLRINAVPNAQ